MPESAKPEPTATKKDRERAREAIGEPQSLAFAEWRPLIDRIAQALADERARNVARLKSAAEGWKGRGMDGITYAIEGEIRELEDHG